MKTLHQTKALVLLSILLMINSVFIFPGCAQQSYTYRFSTTPFSSTPPGGPELQPLGTTMTPITETIPVTTCSDMPTIDLTHFDFNSGFRAKSFFTDHYSIEMIFKFEELNGYNRIIDFSNRQSDYGIYTFYDCLNFYPTGSIGPCPGAFDTTNYKQIVITRNNATKEMNIYVNGVLFTTHTDSTDYYVIGAAPHDSISFFRDDLDFTGEASPGLVALIRICDFELTPQEITDSYNSFCNRITGTQELNPGIDFSIYPNPVKHNITIQLSNVDFSRAIQLTIVNSIGQKTAEIPIHATRTNFVLNRLPPGIQFYQLRIDHTLVKTGKIIVE